MKTKIEQKIMKCKKCKKKTIHIRNIKAWTIGRFLLTTNMIVLTLGLYIFVLLFSSKEKWACEKCLEAL